VSEQAQGLRSAGGALREKNMFLAAIAAEQLGNQVERFGVYLRNTSGEQLIADVEDMATRQPWATIGAGLVAGLALSRGIKVSSSARYQARLGTR